MEIQLLELNTFAFGVIKKDATNKGTVARYSTTNMKIFLLLWFAIQKKSFIFVFTTLHKRKKLSAPVYLRSSVWSKFLGIKENSYLGILLVQSRNVLFTHDKEIIYDFMFPIDR